MSGIVKVYRPNLTDKERLMRELSIKTTLQQYGKEKFESEVKKNDNDDTAKSIR